MSKPPWMKEYRELNRYDWLTAINTHADHFDKPRDLRLANAIMQHVHEGTGLALPTQRTLSQWSRVWNDRQIRYSLDSLSDTGAIRRKRMKDLQPDTLEEIRKVIPRSMRAVVYQIDTWWAFEAFEAYKYRLVHGVEEPDYLKQGREAYRTGTVRNNRTGTVRSIPDYDSPPNTIGDTVLSLDSALSEKVTPHTIVGKEGDLDPVILVPPSDPAQARLWLNAICTDRSRLAEALGRLANNDLPIEFLREIAA